MSECAIYTNGILSGTVNEIDEFLDVLSEIALREGHAKAYVQKVKDSVYDQFHVPKEKGKYSEL